MSLKTLPVLHLGCSELSSSLCCNKEEDNEELEQHKSALKTNCYVLASKYSLWV